MKLTPAQITQLAHHPLFSAIPNGHLTDALKCLNAGCQAFSLGEVLFPVHEPLTRLGIVLSGDVLLEREDFWGTRLVLGHAGNGQIIGEVYACLSHEPIDVWAIATTPVTVLFLDIHNCLNPRSHCPYTAALLSGLVPLLAQRTLALSRRVEHASKHSIRQKVLSYLSQQADIQNSDAFDIPLNRQELADYLGVDRSALSAALSKMKKDKLITCRKNHFTLLEPQ